MSKPRTTVPHSLPHGVDLSDARWRKSSYSGGANDCVEIADLTDVECTGVAIRDSKDPQGAALIIAAESFTAFVQGIDHGRRGVKGSAEPYCPWMEASEVLYWGSSN
ncbi:DUF397 domain-containing protein [Streptomyces sp. UG1]|uniref:DUF397 domain-containing protein n=1 Tax=Streptomyces sp. UG1 TaxID=3417652 RepID=UPI003CF03955